LLPSVYNIANNARAHIEDVRPCILFSYIKRVRYLSVTPVQPFFLLKTSHYYKIKMPDTPIVHFYSFTADIESAAQCIAVPDGSVDMLFTIRRDFAEGAVCGMVTSYSELSLETDAEYFGVRFRPGYLPERLGISIPELVNDKISISGLKNGGSLLESVAGAADFKERVRIVTEFIGDSWRQNSLLLQLISMIIERDGGISVAQLERETLYSARYIGKIMNNGLGLSPKAFCRHMRFQSLINRMNTTGGRLTDLAADTGYYDEPHLIHEFHEFTSIAPGDYSSAVDLPNYNKKIVYIA